MTEEVTDGDIPEEPNPDTDAVVARGRWVPRITHRIRRTDSDGDAAQFKGRFVRRRGWQP